LVVAKRSRPNHPDILTPAEWRVIEGVRHGLTNPAIAARCGLTTDAVKFHVSSALGKLGLSSRQELRRWTGVRADSVLAMSANQDHQTGWTLGQVARATNDLERTANWFRDLVGLTETMRFEGMAFFDCGGVRLYLSIGDPKANSLLYFRVGDIHAEVERLAAAGISIVSAPHRIHVHKDGTEEWMAFFADPDGASIGLMSIVPFVQGEEK
jgi:catechol 2,3-dioxygenase-like lactoylglutathione lyase family enzyme/DNA-binding CsgD family transcriptional regulator